MITHQLNALCSILALHRDGSAVKSMHCVTKRHNPQHPHQTADITCNWSSDRGKAPLTTFKNLQPKAWFGPGLAATVPVTQTGHDFFVLPARLRQAALPLRQVQNGQRVLVVPPETSYLLAP